MTGSRQVVAVEMFLQAIRVSRHDPAPTQQHPCHSVEKPPWAAPQPTAGPAFQRLHPMNDSDTIRDFGGGQQRHRIQLPNIPSQQKHHNRQTKMQRNKTGKTPSGHQFSRLKPAEIDPLAEYGLPSKGEKRLLNYKTQEAYYSKIAERYLAFCTDAGDRDSLQKQFSRLALGDRTNNTNVNTSKPLLPAGSTSTPLSTSHSHDSSTSSQLPIPPSSDNLSQILSALRKLREALVASSRLDDFTTQVYLFAVRLGILSSSFETYLPSLLYLLRVIHRSPSHPLTSVEHHEVVSYLVLDTACRRGDLAEAYSLRNKYKLKDAKVDATLKALVMDDWVSWRRTKRAVDGYRVRLMEFAEPGIRGHVLKAFGRAYLSVGQEYLEESMGMRWEEMVERFGVGWELSKDGRVVIRKIGGRTQ